MDPMMISSAFATLVGLIGQFRSERGAKEQANFNEFSTWMSQAQHAELVNLIGDSQQAIAGIESLIRENQQDFSDKQLAIDNALASYASIIPGFSEIVAAFEPERRLSTQQVDILRQFYESQASKILRPRLLSSVRLKCLDGDRRDIKIIDPRFFEDDLRTLVELQLLRQDSNEHGETMYIFTRSASELIEASSHSA